MIMASALIIVAIAFMTMASALMIVASALMSMAMHCSYGFVEYCYA